MNQCFTVKVVGADQLYLIFNFNFHDKTSSDKCI